MAPEPLDSEETRRLLDTIASLDDLCILFVNQPQIIVVGDQGSGKSSVLEAISRSHFPVGDGVCTRFPVELVLRRAPQEHTSIEVLFDTKSLDVGGRSFSRTTRTRESFVHFGFPRNELPDLINRAKEHMGLEDGKAAGFSRDILLVEIEGPDVPSVTIVDLPGVIHPGLSPQLQDWKPVVDDLIDSYMRRPNSIILTVVSADVPLSAHAVLNRAARFDPDGDRTIGVITKPDLCPSTNIEDQYIRLAKGQEPNHHLPLGWHVLRNRGPKEPAMDYDERDAAEDDFLAEGTRKWWRLPMNRVGVDGLRRNLAEVLLKHIKSRLPGLIEEVENEIESRQARLKDIGASRGSTNEMRDYLLGIAATFHRLAEHAVEGRYNDPFFTSSTVQETSKIKFRKLRALLRNLNRAFDLTMKRKGARYKIEWEQEQDENNGVNAEDLLASYMAEAEAPDYLQPYLDLYEFPDPTPKSEATVNTRIERIASGSQGVEFPGLPNSDLIMQLFRDLSEPWSRIALCHIDIVVERTRLFVYHLFDYILGDDKKTRDAILAECVDPVFEATAETLRNKLTEILRPYTSGHGLPLDLEFRAGLSKRKLARMAAQIAALLEQNQSSLTYNTTSYRLIKYEDARNIVMEANGMTLGSDFGTDVVIDMMLTHYETSLKTFTDNVIYLVIENCLVSTLPDIFSTKVVTQMSEDTLRQIAEEPIKVREERIELAEEIEKLRLGLQECQRSRPRNFSEPADTFPELASPTRATKAPKVPNPSIQTDVKKKVRVRLPPFTQYAKTTTASKSPFGQVASTGVPFGALLKKEPDSSFSASLKGKAPIFGASVNAETDLSEDDDEKVKRVKSESSIFGSSKKVEPGPAASLFGTKAPAVKSPPFGSGATTTTTPVTAFGSVPASSSNPAQSTGSTAATTTPAVKPAFGSQNPPKPAVDSTSGSSATATNTTTATKPLFGSQNPPKPTFGTTTSSSTTAPSAFGPVSAVEASLFGAATATSQASSIRPVFGAATPAPKPSPFGSGTATSQASSIRPVFGAATTTPAPKPPLFGTSTATSQPSSAKPTPSVFGAATSTSQAPTTRFSFGTGLVATSSQSTTPTRPLFGTTAEPPIPASSLFGTGTTSSQSSAPKPSLFAGASTSSQAPAPKSPLFGTSTTSTATTTAAKTTETAPVATSESSNSTPSKTPSTDGLVGSPAAPPPRSSLSGTEKSSSSIDNA